MKNGRADVVMIPMFVYFGVFIISLPKIDKQVAFYIEQVTTSLHLSRQSIKIHVNYIRHCCSLKIRLH